MDAKPSVTSFYWSKNGNRLDLRLPAGKYSGGSQVTPGLTINNLDVRSDPGDYTCTAQNSVGATTSAAVVLDVGWKCCTGVRFGLKLSQIGAKEANLGLLNIIFVPKCTEN